MYTHVEQVRQKACHRDMHSETELLRKRGATTGTLYQSHARKHPQVGESELSLAKVVASNALKIFKADFETYKLSNFKAGLWIGGDAKIMWQRGHDLLIKAIKIMGCGSGSCVGLRPISLRRTCVHVGRPHCAHSQPGQKESSLIGSRNELTPYGDRQSRTSLEPIPRRLP